MFPPAVRLHSPARPRVRTVTITLTPGATPAMLAHNVFFTLKDKTPENIKKVVDSCHKNLTGHPGTVFSAAGVLEPELARPVNDLAFDVALHIVFATRADHDVYQTAPRHQAFIDECRELWASVRVFDSVVD